MRQLWQNLRCSFCALLKNPGFTAVAILSLALGIGANVAIFTLINALLLRDLPVPHPERLVELSVVRHGDKSLSPTPCSANSNAVSASSPACLVGRGL